MRFLFVSGVLIRQGYFNSLYATITGFWWSMVVKMVVRVLLEKWLK
jgi:hypothetical protein